MKLASTHTSSSGTTASSGVPAATRWPTCTERLAITPVTGEIDFGAMQGQRGIAHGSLGRQHLRMIRDGGAVDLRNGLAQLLARRGDDWRASR